jgi:hypothetical protein
MRSCVMRRARAESVWLLLVVVLEAYCFIMVER